MFELKTKGKQMKTIFSNRFNMFEHVGIKAYVCPCSNNADKMIYLSPEDERKHWLSILTFKIRLSVSNFRV